MVVAAAYFLCSFALRKSLSTMTTDFSPFNVEAGTFRKWKVLSPILTWESLLIATFLKSVLTASLATENPAPSTAVFMASKLTGEPALKLMSNEDVLIFGFTDSTNGSLSNAILMALVHMAQVKPAAVRLADLNCADAVKETSIAAMMIIFFI